METGAVNMCCLLALDHDRITLARREPGKLFKLLFCMYFSMKCYFSIVRKSTHESIRSSGSVNLQILQNKATKSISTLPGRDASPSQSYPNIKFVGIHSYTWVERGTVRVERGTVREKYLDQEHNTMSPTRARIRTAISGDERSNYEATSTPQHSTYHMRYKLSFQANAL